MKASAAAIYEIAMGRWSRRLARSFLAFAGDEASPPPSHQPPSLIDVGCGTGSLALAAALRYPQADILGVDLLPAYVAEALRHAAANVRFETGDASALPVAEGAFSLTLSQLLLNDVDDPAQVAAEMVRVTRPGGVVAAAVWDRAGGLPFLRLFLDAAAVAVEKEGEDLRAQVLAVPLRSEESLDDLWRASGLTEVETATLPLRMEFLDFQDYWDSLMGAHSLIRSFAEGLDLETAARLQAAVRRAYLGGSANGHRSLIAAALAVRGLRPNLR